MVSLSAAAHYFERPANRLYQHLERLRREKKPFIDLISTNPSAHGLRFPQTRLERAWVRAARRTKTYQPDPLGQARAREAIGAYYAAQGLRYRPDQIILTPGTSVAYWYLFKLLADPGEEILAPCPSYPLFDSIAALCGVKLTSYALRENAGFPSRWRIDLDDLSSRVTRRTKAVLLVSPHNPTGAVASAEEVDALVAIAGKRGLPIIADEVFSAFLFQDGAFARPASRLAPLVFTLNGFSKMLALPGFKIGWIAVNGEEAAVKRSLHALEMIADTFLPVQDMAQRAVPDLLQAGRSFAESFRTTLHARRRLAVSILEPIAGLSFCLPEGGFYLTLKLERRGTGEEDFAVRLLQTRGVLVHPGYFYDMEGEHVVFSYVARPAVLRQALQRIEQEWRC